MKSLNDIGVECGTDKSTITHCYLDTYEKYLAPLRDNEFVLLELGVAGGASIRMWREYFPNAKVYGIDNNPDCAGEGIFIGDATDEEFIDKVLEEIGEVTIVIEDSGHVGHETIRIFELLFTRIKSGGYMIIEDCATFYSQHYSGKFESNGRTVVYNYFNDLAYHVDIAGRGMCGNPEYAINCSVQEPPVPKYSRFINAIHVHPSIRVIERK